MLAPRADDALFELAHRIVVAKVVDVPVPTTHGRCVVSVAFEVEHAVRGDGKGSVLVVRVPFHVGQSGPVPSVDFPAFAVGERYAVYLSRRGVPLEFVHLRGLPVHAVASLDSLAAARNRPSPPVRRRARDCAFGRVPVGVVCTSHPPAVHVRHEAHLELRDVPASSGLDAARVVTEVAAAAAMWNGIGNVVVHLAPHGRYPITFSEEMPLHGAGLAVTDWQIDRAGTIVDARITMYLHNEAGPIPWSLDARDDCFDLRSTVSHEIGHILGLKHSSTAGDLMEGSAARKGVRRAMTERDRSRVREAYPAGGAFGADVLDQAGRSLVMLARALRRDDTGEMRDAREGREMRAVQQDIGDVRDVRESGVLRIDRAKATPQRGAAAERVKRG